ncbi:MAG: dihydrofolate reductase family protein [Actinomycetes bacterium]
MGQLNYTAITSLDGYVADADGNFDWAAPDADVHAFVNELERPTSTYLYGRRMYEVMSVWETMPSHPDEPIMQDYAQIWRAADKVVYSSTLPQVTSARTRIERRFEPDTVHTMKAEIQADLSIAGPQLAGQAMRAGLVDEVRLFLNPTVVGAGNAALPADLRIDLDLVDEHRFDNGVVYLRYRVL